MADLKKEYYTIVEDHFPKRITMDFGGQLLVYEKHTWKIREDSTGPVVERGLRYGENPGQEAALYRLLNGNLVLGDCRFVEPGEGLVSSIKEEDMLQFGKHPGKTNLTDIDNSLNILKFLMGQPCAVIVKHNNPCGVAYGSSLAEAYARANMADRIAAFGGCAAFNREVDAETAQLIADNYLEVVVAPDYAGKALDLLRKRANLRIVRIRRMSDLQSYVHSRFLDFKSLMDGGIIVQQSAVNRVLGKKDFLSATASHEGKEYRIDRTPTDDELEDLLFGWAVEQGVTSNSVLYVKDRATVGIGTGEQDRVGVAEIAVYKAYAKYRDAVCFKKHGVPFKTLELDIQQGRRPVTQKEEIEEIARANKGGLIGSAMVSDAFFPFRDGVDVGLKEGVRAVVQPGGSLRDYEVIEACNEAGAAMVFTGQRAFKH
ncbi:MAG: IMP cyclohydrolase [Deltaproteobacteria bacterium]|nr:IMP cyclohydrolase [Deltaproteobacteria bacterium]